MRPPFLTILMLCISQITYAQSVNENDVKYAKELKKQFPKDEIAALQYISNYYFELPKGSKQLTVRQHEFSEVIALQANTSFVMRSYFNDNSAIESYSLRQKNGKSLQHDKFCGHYSQGEIFYSDAQLCAYRFSLPIPGQVARYESTKRYHDPKYLTHVFFHYESPVEQREIRIHVPQWATVELLEINFDGYAIDKSTSSENGITTYTYKTKSLEAFPKDEHVPGHLHFIPHILILTKKYDYNNNSITVLSSTSDLYAWYTSLTGQLNSKRSELEPLVKEIIKDLKTDEEKIKAIYYWVQDNIKYIAFEDGIAGFKPAEAHDVYYKRYGDCKGMANLVKELLQIAGYDARLTWVGTDRIPYSYAIPSLAVDNHMICSVFDKGKHYLLDPTESFSSFGAISERIQGKQVMIEDGEKFIIKGIPSVMPDHYTQESYWEYHISENEMAGKGKSIFNGENKKFVLVAINQIKNEDKNRFFRKLLAGTGNPDFLTIQEHSVFDRERPLQISFNVSPRNQYNKFNKEIYIDLDFSDDFKNLSLEKTRKVPYKFSSKVNQKTTAELIIPDKHKLTHIPNPVTIKSEHFEFELKYQVKDNKLLYSKLIKINNNVLPVAAFESWNNAIDQLKKFYDDQVILTEHD